MPEVLIPLGILLTLAFLVSLSYAYDWSVGYLLKLIAGIFIRATWSGPFGLSIGFAFLGHAIESLDNDIRHWIGEGITQTEWAWHETMHQLGVAWHDIAHTTDVTVINTHQAFRTIKKYTIPFAISVAVGPLTPLLKLLQAQVKTLESVPHTVVQKITRVIHAQPTLLTTHELQQIAKMAAADALPVPAAFPNPWPRIRDIAKEIENLGKGTVDTTKKLTVSGALGLVAASVFGVLGLGWLKCSNVNRVGKALCGFDRLALDALLAGLAAVFGTIGLEAFAKDVQGVTSDLEGAVRYFWRATGSGPGGDRALGQAGRT